MAMVVSTAKFDDASSWLTTCASFSLSNRGTEPAPELLAQLAQETYTTDLLLLLVQSISRFEFEARKDVVQIFNNLLRRQIGSRWPTVEYLAGKPDVIFAALAGYENEEVALNTGMILKEMLRHEQLAKILLHSEQYVPLYSRPCLRTPLTLS